MSLLYQVAALATQKPGDSLPWQEYRLALKVDVRLIHNTVRSLEAKNRVKLWWNSINWGSRNFITRKNNKNFIRVLHMRVIINRLLFCYNQGDFMVFPKFRYSPKILGAQPTGHNIIFLFFSVLDWFRLTSRNLTVLLIFFLLLLLSLIFYTLLHWSRYHYYHFSTLLF